MTKDEAKLEAALAPKEAEFAKKRLDAIRVEIEALVRERDRLKAEVEKCLDRERAALKVLAAA